MLGNTDKYSSALFISPERKFSIYKLILTNSKPKELGSSWKGETTPSVELVLLAATVDLVVLF